MIIIDGQRTEMQVSNFSNLEEILVRAMEEERFGNRFVTDVFVNEESFSEIYPHQAEDIDASDIHSVEIRTVSVQELAADVTTELYKVITLMNSGGKRVASLLRQADLGEGLEVLQDVLDVTRHFMGTIGLLRTEYPSTNMDINPIGEKLSAILEEMSNVMVNEDWLLLADIMEYEFLPACSEWNVVLGSLAEEIAIVKAA